MSVRLRALEVEQFGTLTDIQLADLPDGLSVFYGPNEAGKSTLLKFIRFILFGAAGDAIASSQTRLPKGRIQCEVAGERIWLERSGSGSKRFHVDFPDGSVGGQKELTSLLGEAGASLFEHVFAFDLAELATLKSLDDESVVQRILSAGMAGGGSSARDAIKRLHNTANSLVGSSNRAQRVRAKEIATALTEARRLLSAAQEEAMDYAAWRAKEQNAKTVAADRFAATRKLEAQQNRWARLAELWPTWLTLQGATEELSRLGHLPDLGPDARDRFFATQGRRDAAAKARKDQEDRVAALTEKRLTIQFDTKLLALAGKVQQISARWPSVEAEAVRFDRLQDSARMAERSRLEALARLGPDWDQERVLAADGSEATQDLLDLAAQAWRQAETKRQLDLQKAQSEAQEAAQRQATVNELVHRTAEFGPVLGEAEMARRREALRTVRSRLESLRQAEQAQAEKPASFAIWRSQTGLFLLSAAVLGLAGVGGWVSGHPDLSVALLASALVLALVVSTRKAMGLRRVVQQDETVQRAREQLREAAALAGCTDLPTEAEIAFKETQLDEAGKRWDAFQRLSEDLTRAKALAADAEARKDMADRGAEAAKGALIQAKADFSKAAHDAHLPDFPSPDIFQAQSGRIHMARSQAQQAKDAAEEAGRSQEALRAYEGEAREVLAEAGRTVSPDVHTHALGAELSRLAKDVQTALEAQKRQSDLEAAIHDAQAELDRAAQALEEAETDLKTLLGDGNSADPAAHALLLDRIDRKHQLDQQIADLNVQLTQQVGVGEVADQFLQDLATGAVEEWRTQVSEGRASLEILAEERDQALRDEQAARGRAEDIERSADVPGRSQEVLTLEQEATAVLREHLAWWLAERLLTDAVEEFEEIHQPAVLEAASAYLRTMTGGRHLRVRRPERGRLESELTVQGADGRSRFVTELSTGTRQQLYLALRLGLADQFATNAVSLPLVLDDVFVNFDPMRTQGAAQVLGDVVRKHQVIYFTCHPEVADLLVHTVPGARQFAVLTWAAASQASGG